MSQAIQKIETQIKQKKQPLDFGKTKVWYSSDLRPLLRREPYAEVLKQWARSISWPYGGLWYVPCFDQVTVHSRLGIY